MAKREFFRPNREHFPKETGSGCRPSRNIREAPGNSSVGLTLAAEEVLEPLARVTGSEPSGASVLFGVESVAPAHPDLLVQQALDTLHHAGVVLGDHLADFETGVDEPRRRDDLV